MSMGKIFAAMLAIFLALALAGGAGAAKGDSARPSNAGAYAYYLDRLNRTTGADRERVALAIEWADFTGDLTKEEYQALESIYKDGKG